MIESLHHRLHETLVKDVAKKDFPSILPEAKATEALTAMRTSHVTVAPVERDGTLYGIITIEKLLEASDVLNDKDK